VKITAEVRSQNGLRPATLTEFRIQNSELKQALSLATRLNLCTSLSLKSAVRSPKLHHQCQIKTLVKMSSNLKAYIT
jgi:hypothetical protein